MLLRAFPALLFLVLAACGRPLPIGYYETRGSDSQFKMRVELREDGRAQFTTKARLGNPQLDQSVEATMTLADARWAVEKGEVVVTGNRTSDKKTTVHRFVIDATGDLVWKENGARFYKSKPPAP